MERRFYISLYTQFENLGDCVINALLLSQLRQFGDIVAGTSSVPEWFVQFVGLDHAEADGTRWVARKTFAAFALVQALAERLGSGGPAVTFVMKPGHYSVASAPAIVIVRQLLVAAGMRGLNILGVESYRFGASLGRANWIGEVIERLRSSSMRFDGLRDPISLEYANEIGLRRAGACPDLAFLLPHVEKGRSAPGGRPVRIGLSFRQHGMEESESAELERLQRLVERLGSAIEGRAGVEFVLIAQVARDQGYLRRLASSLGIESQLITFDGSIESGRRVFQAYSELDLILTNRLHAMLFAMSRSVIPIAVLEAKHDAKLRGLLRGVGLESQICCDISDVEATVEKVVYAWAGGIEVRERLAQIYRSQRAEIIKIFDRNLGRRLEVVDSDRFNWLPD